MRVAQWPQGAHWVNVTWRLAPGQVVNETRYLARWLPEAYVRVGEPQP